MSSSVFPVPLSGIQESIIAAKGDVLTGTANDVPAVLTVGANETRLVAASGEATGLKYVADTTNYAVAAKGDLLVGTAADTLAPLTVGANGTTLVADSSEATGLKWATPTSGGGLTLISEYVANAETGIAFSSISGSFKQLLMMWSGIRHSAASNQFGLRFNNDSATNYYMSGGNGLNLTAAYDVHTASHACGATSGIKLPAFGINANNTALEKDVKGMLLIDNYASATKGKSFQLNNGFFIAADSQSVGTNTNGYYDSTSAITSLDIVRLAGAGTISNASNTTIRLYGVN